MSREISCGRWERARRTARAGGLPPWWLQDTWSREREERQVWWQSVSCKRATVPGHFTPPLAARTQLPPTPLRLHIRIADTFSLRTVSAVPLSFCSVCMYLTGGHL